MEYYVKYICTYKFRLIVDAALYTILKFWEKLSIINNVIELVYSRLQC